MGVRRLDRCRRPSLHPRQRHRARPSARRTRSSARWRSPRRGRRDRRSSTTSDGDLCGHGTACAGVVRSLAPDVELTSVRVLGAGYTGSGAVLLAGLELGDRAGFPRRQHEPLDDEEAVRRTAARARGRCLLQAHDARRLRAQHAGRELPVAFRERHLGRQPRGGPTRSRTSTTRRPPVEFFARGLERRRGVARRRDDPLHRQQLRDTAHRRHLRARPRQASGADAVPAQERPLPDRHQRGGRRA